LHWGAGKFSRGKKKEGAPSWKGKKERRNYKLRNAKAVR